MHQYEMAGTIKGSMQEDFIHNNQRNPPNLRHSSQTPFAMTLDQKSGLRLEYATSDDAEAIAPLFAQSFHDHAYFRRMIPDTTETRIAWADIFRFATKDPSTICLKVTDDETGQITSHGRWVRPKKKDADAQPGHEERWSALDPYLDVETAEALFGAFERNRHGMMEDRKHYCKPSSLSLDYN